jgi:hypothetical protein
MPEQNPDDDERDRTKTNLFLFAMFIVIVGGGYWLVDALIAQRDRDNCVAQGRRNCGERIEVPSR